MTGKDTRFSKDYQPATAASNKRRPIMTEALMIALHREVEGIIDGDGKPTRRLTQIADKLTEKAAEGDTAAIKEVFDRTEGKAAQALILQGDEDRPIQMIERIIVKAANQDG